MRGSASPVVDAGRREGTTSVLRAATIKAINIIGFMVAALFFNSENVAMPAWVGGIHN